MPWLSTFTFELSTFTSGSIHSSMTTAALSANLFPSLTSLVYPLVRVLYEGAIWVINLFKAWLLRYFLS